MLSELKPALLPLVGDDYSFDELHRRTEYRTSLIRALAGRRATPSEYILESQWDPDTGLSWEIDFRRTADREAWGWKEADSTDEFSETLTKHTEELRSYRRWG